MFFKLQYINPQTVSRSRIAASAIAARGLAGEKQRSSAADESCSILTWRNSGSNLHSSDVSPPGQTSVRVPTIP